MLRRTSALGLFSCLSVPATALAHTGGTTHSFLAGALHPLSGLDHLFAMLAVGLLAGCSTGRLRWGLPLAFVVSMIGGAGIGASGIRLPLVEVAIALSLIAFGAALVWKHALREPVLVAMIAGFALTHGHAHGTEMGPGLSAASYAAGFVLATALLHVVGVLVATRMLSGQQLLLKCSGGAIAGLGVASLSLLLMAPI